MSIETTSPFGNIYLKVQQRITAEVPELYVDQDLGQLDHYDIRPAVSFPCALLDVDDFTFTDNGNNTQQGIGMLKIRLAVAAYSPSNNLAPNEVKLKALGYYDIEQKIQKALQGWKGEGFSRLLRAKAKTELRNDNIRVRQIAYSVFISDDSCKPTTTTLATPAPSFHIDKATTP